MDLTLEINGRTDAAGRYVSYAPSPCVLRQSNGTAAVTVALSSRAATPTGGEVVLYAGPGQPSTGTLSVTVPASGASATFWVGGKWQRPSVEDRDCLLVAGGAGPQQTFPLMVRLRKNANRLTAGERDRFLRALRDVNRAPSRVYKDFRDMHVNRADPQEHRGPHFLPWHRAYLLDLERELQRVDATVSLHYWRFDQPAPNVFREEFLGRTARIQQGDGGRDVAFSQGHPLSGWSTDDVPGILRGALFDPLTEAAPGLPLDDFPLLTQEETLALGTRYPAFARMEGTPHGAAHVSFEGSISDIDTAPKDPLFFLLHSNVDRLWALWQWLRRRFDPRVADAYTGQPIDGRRVGDTLWPWNDVKTLPRPDFAPRGQSGLADSPQTPAPGKKPTVGSVVDLQGHVSPLARLGYGYDDVPFEPSAAGPIQ